MPALILLAFVGIYLFLDPESSSLFPKCPFLMCTELQCPGCGSQRAIHALLNGHPGVAFRHNALLVSAIPAILFLIATEALRKRYPHWYSTIHTPWLSRTILIIVLLWWVGRNLLGV